MQRSRVVELTADGDPAQPGRREIMLSVVRLFVGFAALIGIVALIGWVWRAELERFGKWFVTRFGAAGMAGGAFLADGLHFPLPPQFYLLTGIAGGFHPVPALMSVLAGSVMGGLVAFAIARRLGGTPFFEKRFGSTRVLLERLMRWRRAWGLVIAGMLPVSYFALCALCGMMRLRYRDYAILAVMRVPRLALSYALIVLAWGQ